MLARSGLAAALVVAVGCGRGAATPSTPTAVTSTSTSSTSTSTSTTTTSVAVESPPVLSVTIVDLSGSYDAATSRLASLDCTFRFGSDINDRWCFGVFGRSISAGRVSPSYDYKVTAGATVRAATAGIVSRIEAETNPLYPGEFEIETRAAAGGTYQVIYDHVRNVTVVLGSPVTPGMTLGIAGIHTSNAAVWGRVELQVNRITQTSPTIVSVSLCPRAFGTAAFNADHDKALAAHNAANPAFAALSVCAMESVSP